MGERVAVKRGSTFERTSSQKKQLALQTENSTVGISLFQGLTSTDNAMLGEDRHSRSQSEEELSSAAFAGPQPGGGEGVAGGGWSSGGDQQGGAGGGQGVVGGGQQLGGQQGYAEGASGGSLSALVNATLRWQTELTCNHRQAQRIVQRGFMLCFGEYTTADVCLAYDQRTCSSTLRMVKAAIDLCMRSICVCAWCFCVA